MQELAVPQQFTNNREFTHIINAIFHRPPTHGHGHTRASEAGNRTGAAPQREKETNRESHARERDSGAAGARVMRVDDALLCWLAPEFSPR